MAFCNSRLIKHIECPIRYHCGNGEIERLTRTINERLRTNKQIILKRDNSVLSEILLRCECTRLEMRNHCKKTYVGTELNTIKKLIIYRKRPISEPQKVKLSTSDFDSGQDSAILVRERVRGSKLEEAYEKRKSVLLNQSEHTITFLPAGTNQETIISGHRQTINPRQPIMQFTRGRQTED